MISRASTSERQSGSLLEGGEAQSPFVSVAIITLNSISTIQRCLQALVELDYPKDRSEIVIVDGGSTDGTVDLLQKYPVKIVIDTRKNRGVARNTAVNNCKGEIIAFTDADCTPLKSWLTDHVSVHSDPHVLVVAGAVLQGGDFGLPTTIYHQTYFATQSPTTSRRKTWEIASANASFKTSTFKLVGPFPELDRGEESLLSWRVLQAGFDVVFDPSPRVVHLHSHMSYRSLFKRSWDEGYSDRCLQTAFGNVSPFRLPRGFWLALMLSPCLTITRAGRYLIKMLAGGYGRLDTVVSLPVLLATSLYWLHGYITAAKNLEEK